MERGFSDLAGMVLAAVELLSTVVELLFSASVSLAVKFCSELVWVLELSAIEEPSA